MLVSEEAMKYPYRALLILLLPLLLGIACRLTGTGGKSANQAIMGQWRQVNGSETIEFSEDGKVIIRGAQITATGDYIFTEEDQIRLELTGIWGLTEGAEFQVTVSEGHLSLTDSSGFVREYVRADQARQVTVTKAEADTVHPTETVPPEKYRLEVTQLLLGDEAVKAVEGFHPKNATYHWRPEAGWQFASVGFVLENASNSWLSVPSSYCMQGTLTDSGGYPREAEGIELDISGTSDYETWLPSKLYIAGMAWFALPQNQTPEHMRLQIDDDRDGQMDETFDISLSDAISSPSPIIDTVRSTPWIANVPFVADIGNEARITVTKVSLEQPFVDQRARLRLHLTIENVGGHDFSLDPHHFLGLRGLTDSGQYFQGLGWPTSSFEGQLAPGLSSDGWITSAWFEARPDDPDEVLAIITLGSHTSLVLAARVNRSAELDAIKRILDKHRTVLIDTVKSGDSSPLGEVYLDPSSVSDSELGAASPLKTVTCQRREDSERGWREDVYEVLDSEIVAYVFLSDPTAIVATSETRQQWDFECPAFEALTKRGDPKEAVGCYRLERRHGVWRIATVSVPAWTATPVQDCIP